jgi:hypothetical protein
MTASSEVAALEHGYEGLVTIFARREDRLFSLITLVQFARF